MSCKAQHVVYIKMTAITFQGKDTIMNTVSRVSKRVRGHASMLKKTFALDATKSQPRALGLK